MTKTKELEIVLTSVRTTLQKCQAENEKLIQVARFYAETPWKELSLIDRGEKARETLREVFGNGRSEAV